MKLTPLPISVAALGIGHRIGDSDTSVTSSVNMTLLLLDCAAVDAAPGTIVRMRLATASARASTTMLSKTTAFVTCCPTVHFFLPRRFTFDGDDLPSYRAHAVGVPNFLSRLR